MPFIQHRNRTVRLDNSGIIENALAETYLSADISASSGTLTVKDIKGFSTGDFVWINPFSPNSEIIAVHASTDPSGNTITLASNTSFAHNANERVYYVEFDQVEIAHASTIGGSKSTLATEDIYPIAQEQLYLDTSQTSGFYFARYKDSIASTTGNYTDGVAYDGWADSSVGAMIDKALDELGIRLSDKLTINTCINWLNEGLRFIQGKLKRWPEHFAYNEVIGQAQRGDPTITMPSDAYDTETSRSVLAVRVGDGKQLRYLSPNEFDAQLEGVKYTQVRTQASANDTSLAVDNSYDFKDGDSDNPPTLSAYISGSKDTFTYTGVTRDDADGGTAAFTGIPSSGDDSIENTLPVDTFIWQDEDEGQPRWYTVRNGNLWIWPLVDGQHDNANVYMDYAKVATAVDSEIDTIDYHRYDMLFYYLCWRMEGRDRNNGQLNLQSGWYIQFKEALNDAIRTLPSLKSKMMPRINRMDRHGGQAADLQDLDISDQ